MKLRAYYQKSLYTHQFVVGVLSSKMPKTCIYCVLKFLNLSNKVPAGVRVRMSKCLYMDICGGQKVILYDEGGRGGQANSDFLYIYIYLFHLR